jgi:phage terminase large subunit-like protein
MADLLSPKETLALLVEGARLDFGSYMGFVHQATGPGSLEGWALPAAHHEVIIGALTDDELGHTLIVTPRGSGKTTLVQGWLEWMLGRASLGGGNWAEDWRALYVTNTATQAYKISLAIKDTIEFNDKYHVIFPKVKKYGEKWSETEWRVQGNQSQKDPTFQAMGITGPALGSRATIIVLDDIADQENMGTLLQRTRVIETLTNTIMPILVPGGRIVMAATRWHWNDPPWWAMEQRWHTIYMKALVGDDPKSYWPERFKLRTKNRDGLLDLKEADPRAFARQYQNEVAPDEGLIFERIWFEDRFNVMPTEIAMRVDSWDTASGQGRNRSYSAGISVLVTPDWHIYILNVLRGQLPYADLKEAMRMTARRNKSNAVIIEKKSSGEQAAQEMRAEGLPVIEWQPFGQKGSPTRLEANNRVSAICAQKRVHLPSDYFCRQAGSMGWLELFEREIFSYPESENDDQVDAFCQLLYFVEELRLRGMRFQQPEPVLLSSGDGKKVMV